MENNNITEEKNNETVASTQNESQESLKPTERINIDVINKRNADERIQEK